MHPHLLTFLKLTGLLAAAIAAFFIFVFLTGLLVKLVLIAAVAAALVMAGFFVYNLVVRRKQLPVIR